MLQVLVYDKSVLWQILYQINVKDRESILGRLCVSFYGNMSVELKSQSILQEDDIKMNSGCLRATSLTILFTSVQYK